MNPHIHTWKSAGKAVWNAAFAIRLVSCSAERFDRDAKQDAASRWVGRQMDLINALYSSTEQRTFALRFIARPEARVYSAGRVEIVLLGRVGGASKAAALASAGAFCSEAISLLASAMPDYQWAVVEDEQTFQSLWTPFPFEAAHVCEFRRREELASLESWRSRPSLGRGRTSTALPPAEQRSAVYFVHQFLPRPTTLDRFLRAFLLQSNPVVFQVALNPVRLLGEERAALHELIGRAEAASTRDGRNPVVGEPSIHHSRAKALCEGLLELTSRLEDAPFEMQVSLASPLPLAASLAESVGTEITQPVWNRLSDSGEVGKPAVLQGGGCDVIRPDSAEEAVAARQNLAQLEFNEWGPSLAPTRLRRLRRLVDAAEAASVFRFPLATLDGLAGVDVSSARCRSMSREQAALIGAPEGEKLLIGHNLAHGQQQPVFLSDRDRRQHTYVIGQTGTGKTTLLRTMILNDIAAGRGLVVLDPHGDLFRDLLAHIPAHRAKDVVVFDPTDMNHSVGLNLLECNGDDERYFVVREMRAILERLMQDQFGRASAEWMGPVFFQHMQMNMLLAMSNDADPGTLLEFYQIFQTKDYWKRWTPLKWADSRLRSWTENNLPTTDYLRRGSDNQLTWGEYLSSKFDDFVFDPKLRLIFGQKRSTICLRKIMDEGKILLVNLAKGELAELNSRFLGMVLLAKLQAAAMGRSNLPLEKRRLFYVYVDEFQSIATGNFVSMLSEARKFGLALVLANQFLTQMGDERIMAGVCGNVGTQFSFRVGRADAEALEPQFTPYFDRFDLGNLPNWTACVRTTVNGQVTPPFTLRTVPYPRTVGTALAADIIVNSRARHTKPRAQVEEEIARSVTGGKPETDSIPRVVIDRSNLNRRT